MTRLLSMIKTKEYKRYFLYNMFSFPSSSSDFANHYTDLISSLSSIVSFFFLQDEGIYSTPLCLEDDAMSISSQVRKARSMDASCQDLSTLVDELPSRPLTRARSEFNLDHNRFTREWCTL